MPNLRSGNIGLLDDLLLPDLVDDLLGDLLHCPDFLILHWLLHQHWLSNFPDFSDCHRGGN